MPKRHQHRRLGILIIARKEDSNTVTGLESAPIIVAGWEVADVP